MPKCGGKLCLRKTCLSRPEIAQGLPRSESKHGTQIPNRIDARVTVRRLMRPMLAVAALTLFGCGKPVDSNQVIVYCALDREFSEPILNDFEQKTGVKVLAKYDTESTKSVGLAEQLIREQTRPRCDVFWNNEFLNTLRLVRAGVIQPYASPVGLQYPQSFRGQNNEWFGFAARVRVLLVNTKEVDQSSLPKRLEDLALPRWRGRIGIAKPLFGTTATHVACLFASMGAEKAEAFLRQLKENEVRILSGNKQVAVEVGSGALAMGLTDTDDSLAEIHARRPVKMVFLDQGTDERGMLVIPNTVAVVRGSPHRANAERLVDYLLDPEVEAKLALGPSGQLPLHPNTAAKPGLGLPENPRLMTVDFSAAVEQWDRAMKFIKDEFTVP